MNALKIMSLSVVCRTAILPHELYYIPVWCCCIVLVNCFGMQALCREAWFSQEYWQILDVAAAVFPDQESEIFQNSTCLRSDDNDSLLIWASIDQNVCVVCAAPQQLITYMLPSSMTSIAFMQHYLIVLHLRTKIAFSIFGMKQH